MFTTLIAHAKTIALAGTVACGGAFGTHAAYTHLHNDRDPVRYEQRFDRDDHRPAQPNRFDNHDNRTPDFHANRNHR